MKKTKKLWAFLLAMIMVLAMGMTIMAADLGSITVSPANEGQTYTLYKLFDAEITLDDSGDLLAINYKLPNGKADLGDGTDWFEIQNGFVVAKEGLTSDWAKNPAAIAWAKSFGTKVQDSITATKENLVSWGGLEYGYYYVDSTLGSFIGVDSAAPNATIQDKNNPPTIDKKITGVGRGNDIEDAAWPSEGKDEKEFALAEIGDTIDYEVTVVAKPGAENYVVTDTLSEGLTPPTSAEVEVKVGDTTLDDSLVNVTVTGQVIKIAFAKEYLDTIKIDTTIVITYSAILNDNAENGTAGNANDVVLTWGHDPSVNTAKDDTVVFTVDVNVFKYYKGEAESEIPLEGAEFALQNAEGKYYKYDSTNGVTWVDSVNDATRYMTGSDGKLVNVFKGLKDGTYTLVETVVPAGFNKTADESFKITSGTGDSYEVGNLETRNIKVLNNKGVELPSTGGIGTTMFYVIGGALVLVAVVLLVTRKRMSAEK